MNETACSELECMEKSVKASEDKLLTLKHPFQNVKTNEHSVGRFSETDCESQDNVEELGKYVHFIKKTAETYNQQLCKDGVLTVFLEHIVVIMVKMERLSVGVKAWKTQNKTKETFKKALYCAENLCSSFILTAIKGSDER